MSYLQSLDVDALLADHPIGDGFIELAKHLSRDELFARQDRLFKRCIARAWQTGFYSRLWGAQGIERGDIQGLDDIAKLPVFDKSDLMASIAKHPPFGDFGGFERTDPARDTVILHTTSGTTGTPQVLLFGPKSREAQNLLLARAYLMQGVGAADVVHSVYGHGLINGGHYIREAFLHWTNAIFLSAGTGVETPSARQVEIMRDFGVTVLVGFADYLKRLAEVANERGFMQDIALRMISGQMGREDRVSISEMWGGAECFDWYGVGDTGLVAAESIDHDGLYIMEDAHYVELLDLNTGAPTQFGETGEVVCTCLFKDDVYPIIRFNTHDVSRELGGASSLGFGLRRMDGFLGRGDNMVKVKGINVFPQAIGPMLDEVPEFLGEYVCRMSASGEFSVHLEVSSASGALRQRISALLKAKLGVSLTPHLVGKGETASLTGVERRQKPIRLIDERFK